jgi:transglutaminase-like putative cysteine protease
MKTPTFVARKKRKTNQVIFYPFLKHNLMENYLKSTYFLDYEQEKVAAFAKKHTETCTTLREKAIALYNAVRDGFYYNPYDLNFNKEGLKASDLLNRKHGYCIEKAVLLAASARAANIPSRLSFYDVKNHIATDRLCAILGTNVLVFHGAAELYLDGEWLKTTPAFNASLCEKLGVASLEFDGFHDSIFQEYDASGDKQFMEYLHDYGSFDDVPYDLLIETTLNAYPQFLENEEFKSGKNRHFIFT